jgi:hypothetical protein
MSAAIAADPLTADLLNMADDAIEARTADMSGCADCKSRAGSGPCTDHAADDRMVAVYERIRARIEAGEFAALTAQGGNQ